MSAERFCCCCCRQAAEPGTAAASAHARMPPSLMPPPLPLMQALQRELDFDLEEEEDGEEAVRLHPHHLYSTEEDVEGQGPRLNGINGMAAPNGKA